jgi:hypothetical protein
MTRSIVLMLLCVLAATRVAGAAATPLAITRDEQRDVMITIYNGNLGLVKDVRETRLPVATGEVQFMDVAALIDPTTVHLKSLTDPSGLAILEQNYEYDRAPEQQGQPPWPAAAEGQGPRLQGGPLGQPAVYRGRLDRPHAQGRAREDQDGQRLRCGRRADPEGLAKARQ